MKMFERSGACVSFAGLQPFEGGAAMVVRAIKTSQVYSTRGAS